MSSIRDAIAVLVTLGVSPDLIGAVAEDYAGRQGQPAASTAAPSKGALRTRRWRANKVAASHLTSPRDGGRQAVTADADSAADVQSSRISVITGNVDAPGDRYERHHAASPGVTERHRSVTHEDVRQKEFPPTPPYKKKQKIPKRALRETSQGHFAYVFRGGAADLPTVERITVRRQTQPELFEAAVRLSRFNATFRSFVRDRAEWSFPATILAQARQALLPDAASATGPPVAGTG